MGVTEQQLIDLREFETSEAFDDRERAALALAVAMAQTPTDISTELSQRLRQHFDEPQLVELTAAIAWEHYRSRFNRVFGVQPAGFSEGSFCVLPERRAV